MRFIWISALSFFTPVPRAAFATPVVPWDDTHVKHTWHTVPTEWENLGHPSAGTTIDIDFALKSDREGAVIDALSEISDPKHPKYREFLSKEELDELVKPSPDSLQLVSSWLTHHSIPSSSISTIHGGNWLTVTDLRLSQANQLLGASYRLYRNTKTNETTIRTVGYSLPTVLHPHIQTVIPTTCFPSMQVTLHTPHKRSFGPAPAPAAAAAASGKLGTRLQPPPLVPITVPANVRFLYGTSAYVPAAAPGRNLFGVVGDRRPSWSDLTDFMVTFQGQSIGATFTLLHAEPGLLESSRTSSVAIQFASAMAYPTAIFYFGSKISEMSLTRFLTRLDYLPVIQTISISYNYFTEPSMPPELAASICHQFARLGARGLSILVASGNLGVGPEDDEDCKDEEGNINFVPEFPSSCPWVTSVGGTEYFPQEVASGTSGGGFSNLFPRPDYQNNAVLEFINNLRDENSGYYNDTGRGYPDISAQGARCAIFRESNHDVSMGTACAVATVAGIVALLNDFLLSAGRRPLGFLNPWLYGVGSIGLTDISGGSNPGCGTNGFSAVTGWDPVTGLGTPLFGLLRDSIPPDSERPEFIPPPPP